VVGALLAPPLAVHDSSWDSLTNLMQGSGGALLGSLGAGLVAVLTVWLTRGADRSNSRAADARAAAADLIEAGYKLISAGLPGDVPGPDRRDVMAWHGAALRGGALIRAQSPGMSNLVEQAIQVVGYRQSHPLPVHAPANERAFHQVEPVAALNDMLAAWLASGGQRRVPSDVHWEPGVEIDILRQAALQDGLLAEPDAQ